MLLSKSYDVHQSVADPFAAIVQHIVTLSGINVITLMEVAPPRTLLTLLILVILLILLRLLTLHVLFTLLKPYNVYSA